MRVKPLILVPVIAVALAACSAQAPVTPTTEAAVEQPLFSTDEEALAAAQAAYAHYLEVSDQIARDGGANHEKLKGLVSVEQLQVESQNSKEYVSSGFHGEGHTNFDTFHIADADQRHFSAYLCVDVTNFKLVNAEGTEVTPITRVNRWPLLVNFSFDSSGKALISGSETWTGTNFC